MSYGKPTDSIPLKPAVLHILLALSKGPTHGLGIADAVEDESAGEVRLGPGTLYRSLKEMHDAGLLQQAADGDDPRRKNYRITSRGFELLQAETQRLSRIVETARERRVLTGGR